MKSDGGLVSADKFSGLRAVLSGPAGGVVGCALTAYSKKRARPIIGFDMVRPCQLFVSCGGGTVRADCPGRAMSRVEHLQMSLVTPGHSILCLKLSLRESRSLALS